MAMKNTTAPTRAATAPIHDPLPEWAEVACAHWPFLRREWLRNTEDVDRFEREARDTFRDRPSEDELLRAVRWLSGPEGRQDKPPTVRQVFRAVFILRKRDRSNDGGDSVRWYDRERKQYTMLTVADLRGMIGMESDPEGRWDIICDVLNDTDDVLKADLARYAESLPGGLVRFRRQGADPVASVSRAWGAA
jgi:hypothetical protein